MIINFDAIEGVKAENFRGGDKYAILQKSGDERNNIVKITLEPGASIGFHTHEVNCEIMYIIRGEGHVIENDKSRNPIKAGMSQYCPQGQGHSLINDGSETLELFAVIAAQ